MAPAGNRRNGCGASGARDGIGTPEAMPASPGAAGTASEWAARAAPGIIAASPSVPDARRKSRLLWNGSRWVMQGLSVRDGTLQRRLAWAHAMAIERLSTEG
jgi:hypothetical protein